MAALRWLELNEVEDVTVVYFKEERIVEQLQIQELGQELYRLVDVEHRSKLVLNLAAVEHLSSAALEKFIVLDAKVKAAGGLMKLCSVRSAIYEVFEITRLNRLFDIVDDEADALAAL